jgi:hypothetical protein
LLALSSERTYEGWTLFSALEPCHLCLAASRSTRIGRVSFASADAYGGAVGVLPELLLIAHCLWRRPDGDVVRYYRGQRPDLVALAAELPSPEDTSGTLPGVHATVTAAFASRRLRNDQVTHGVRGRAGSDR